MQVALPPAYGYSMYPGSYYSPTSYLPMYPENPLKSCCSPSEVSCDCDRYKTPVKSTKQRAGSFPKDEGLTPEKLRPNYTEVQRNFHPQQALGGSSIDGSYNEKAKRQSGEGQYTDLQYKKPKRMFNTKEERLEFVRSYLAKEKTELCKNWEAYGWCKFGDRCSFAHGVHELRFRTDMPPTFKARQCKQYSEHMICPYGGRCQFIHNPLTLEKQRNGSYSKMLQENIGYIEARANSLCDKQLPVELDDNTIYISSYERRRLNVFCKLADGARITKKD